MGRILLTFSLFITTACAVFGGSKDSESAELYLRMGSSQFESGNYPGALASLLKAEELDPTNPAIQNNLGLVYFMRQRLDLSEKHLRKALSLNSKYSEARNNLARVLIEEGKFKEAEKEVRIVIDDLTYPGVDKAYINLGLVQFNLKHYNEAKDTFLNALNASRDNCVANTYYGRSFFEMKDYAKAAPALDTAIGFCQRALFDEPHYYSALTYYRLGDKEKSMARFSEIVKLYPDGKYRDKSKAMLEMLRKAE
ncbi:tetratricopeptide repeat protein [Bdellovibrio sp. HCB337]|uniref:tetratricopeptide repeat protein n=1 Tax=Bdellovibrio sp. HCB337 TaxID=3394358 RepID=UPI0039A54B45